MYVWGGRTFAAADGERRMTAQLNEDADVAADPSPSSRRSRLFRNGNSQALRVPAALAFEAEGEVEVWREGDRLIVRPVRRGGGFRFSYDDPERVALGLRREAPPEREEAAVSDPDEVWDVDDPRWTDEIFGGDWDEASGDAKPRGGAAGEER